MVHVLDEVTRYSKEGDPLRAIAYEEGAVRDMARAARLEVLAIDRGTWAGEPGRVFQDVVVFRRSASDTTIDPEPKGPGPAARAVAAARPAGAWLRRFPSRARRRVRRLLGRS